MPTQDNAEAIVNFYNQFQQAYQALKPFFTIGITKSQYLFERTDPCQAGTDALMLLAQRPLVIDTLALPELLEIDKAMNRLARLGNRISGEVWQLVTERVPNENSAGFHVLNTLLRQSLTSREQPLLDHSAQSCFAPIADAIQEVITHHDGVLSPLPLLLQPIFNSVEAIEHME